VCISWIIKCLISLMHGVTMKKIYCESFLREAKEYRHFENKVCPPDMVNAENIVNKQSQVPDKWWFSALGFVRGANDIWTRKMQHITKRLTMFHGFNRFWRSLEISIRRDLEKTWESMDWIHLAQERDRWPALVNTVKKFRVP